MAKKIKKPKKITQKKLKSMARTAKRKALAEWSLKVRERDGMKCAVCGKTEYLNAHHLIPKERFPQHQLEVINGITVCPLCHKYGSFSFHRHPLWSSNWLAQNRPEQYVWVMETIRVDLESIQQH
jgi:5-methylcytosine-specific restriction endonuclease McrA